MKSMNSCKYSNDVSEKRNGLSYVIINPSCDQKLELGDVIFLIRPSPISSVKIFMKRGSVRAKSAPKQKREKRKGDTSEESLQAEPLLSEQNQHENGTILIPNKGSIDVEITPPAEGVRGTIV
ncbi:UNVERIFIED_CONTAM: hypothetical protein NCL1_23869 [Trichonephila clavipes]